MICFKKYPLYWIFKHLQSIVVLLKQNPPQPWGLHGFPHCGSLHCTVDAAGVQHRWDDLSHDNHGSSRLNHGIFSWNMWLFPVNPLMSTLEWICWGVESSGDIPIPFELRMIVDYRYSWVGLIRGWDYMPLIWQPESYCHTWGTTTWGFGHLPFMVCHPPHQVASHALTRKWQAGQRRKLPQWAWQLQWWLDRNKTATRLRPWKRWINMNQTTELPCYMVLTWYQHGQRLVETDFALACWWPLIKIVMSWPDREPDDQPISGVGKCPILGILDITL